MIGVRKKERPLKMHRSRFGLSTGQHAVRVSANSPLKRKDDASARRS